MRHSQQQASNKADVDAVLVQRFNADARPLSLDALEILRGSCLAAGPLGSSACEAMIQAVLAKLTSGP